MIDKKINPEIIEEASDSLGSPDSQEESDEREQYDRAVKAVDDFIEKHPTYKATDENRQAILDYLESHDLAISPASLELVWEQIGDRLLADQPEAVPPKSKDEDASVRLATAALARKSKSDEEPPESGESKPEMLLQEEIGKRGKPTAWRNGRRLDVGA